MGGSQWKRMADCNAIERFSARVEDYFKFRPGYAQSIVAELRDECGLAIESVVADIGSGTGLLTRLFLENGNRVLGVEPNAEMRRAGERALLTYAAFQSVVGRAEDTTLPPESVDFIVVGQAFHWFDPVDARAEFGRILKPGGWVVLVWNQLDTTAPFLREYADLLSQYALGEPAIDHRERDSSAAARFFGKSSYKAKMFPQAEELDYESLQGRLLSLSFTPQVGHPSFDTMLAQLRTLYLTHANDGLVTYSRITTMFYGQLAKTC
jgi:SAM-dependent methyltransferase